MKFAFLFLFLFNAGLAMAHPVAFQDSVGIMGHHSPMLTHNQLNYSFKYWWAMGVHHFKRPDALDNRHASLASTNFLLKRWYGDAFQANVYAILGGGKSELLDEPKDVGMGMLQFDIEDRKYYFLAQYLQLTDSDDTQLEQTTVRAGLAPYVGNFDDLHTWFILEWSENRFLNEKPEEDLTPYLRFFYKNVLFEIGQSFDGATRFNYIIHY
tara:strand:+ start:4235 stop:4867 length:633 start_codon:yes stop_codon:yes gene_type:complete